MSEKAMCPACDSYTSSIWWAFAHGEQCPVCGLPADVAQVVEQAQARGADVQLAERLAQAEARAVRAEEVANRLRADLRAVCTAVREVEGRLEERR